MRFDVIIDAIMRTGGALKKLTINNFSKAGVGVISGEPLVEGEDLEIELMIPGDNMPVIFEGEIAWASAPGPDENKHKTGIRFKKISTGDKSRVLEHIYEKWIVPSEEENKNN